MSGTRTPGQVAFEAYAEQSEGKSLVSGAELPVWEMLPRDIQDAWEAAASAVLSVPPGAWPEGSSGYTG